MITKLKAVAAKHFTTATMHLYNIFLTALAILSAAKACKCKTAANGEGSKCDDGTYMCCFQATGNFIDLNDCWSGSLTGNKLGRFDTCCGERGLFNDCV